MLFDQLLRERGRELPYPIMEEWFVDVDDAIREVKAEMTELDGNGDYAAVQKKMHLFRFLKEQRDRGIVRISMGTRAVRELQ